MIITTPEPSTRLAREFADRLRGLGGDGWQRALDEDIIWDRPPAWIADPSDTDTLAYPVAAFSQGCRADMCARNEWTPETGHSKDDCLSSGNGREWSTVARVLLPPQLRALPAAECAEHIITETLCRP